MFLLRRKMSQLLALRTRTTRDTQLSPTTKLFQTKLVAENIQENILSSRLGLAFLLLWLNLRPESSHTLRATLLPCASFGRWGLCTWLALLGVRPHQESCSVVAHVPHLCDVRPTETCPLTPLLVLFPIENVLDLVQFVGFSAPTYVVFRNHIHLGCFHRWPWPLWHPSGPVLWEGWRLVHLLFKNIYVSWNSES